MSVKQVIVCRMQYPDGKGGTFKPRLGKLAAQVSHASLQVLLDYRVRNLRSINISSEESLDVPVESSILLTGLSSDIISWIEGNYTKVVLGVDTEEELLKVHALALGAGLPTSLIQDIGATEFHGVPTFTTCAIGPADSVLIDKITGPEGTVRTRLL